MSPCTRSPRSLTISSAAAASESWLEVAAVTVPPSISGGSERILSRSGARGPSSAVTPATGSISRSNLPSARAAMARSCERTANSSIAARLSDHFAAIISAARNCDTSASP